MNYHVLFEKKTRDEHMLSDFKAASRQKLKCPKVTYLGPAATFTHLAALRRFGSSAQYLPEVSIKGVFEAVANASADYGVVPIENSIEGVVSYTLDMLVESKLKITSEVMLEVSQSLLLKSWQKSDIKKIYSHPHAAAQCRIWLEKNMRGVPVLDAASTASAAELAARESTSAAIASELAATVYGLRVVERGIEDCKNNYTRFFVISKSFTSKTGQDKTSIMFVIKDRPGALCNILIPFKKTKINLTKIESRPSKRKAWEYIFFVDIAGHIEDEAVKRAIEEMRRYCVYLKVLGSYPSGEYLKDSRLRCDDTNSRLHKSTQAIHSQQAD